MLILQLVGISYCHVLWSRMTDLLNLSRIWNNCLKKKTHTLYVQASVSVDRARNAYRIYGHFHRGAAKPKINYWEQPRIVVVIIAIWEIAYLGLSKSLPGLVTQWHIASSRRGPLSWVRILAKKRKKKKTRGRRGRRHESERDKRTQRVERGGCEVCLLGLVL